MDEAEFRESIKRSRFYRSGELFTVTDIAQNNFGYKAHQISKVLKKMSKDHELVIADELTWDGKCMYRAPKITLARFLWNKHLPEQLGVKL